MTMVPTSSYKTVLSGNAGLKRQVTEQDASRNAPIRESDGTRPEELPNHSNPAPEIWQPKITASAGRPAVPRASREVSFRSERQQEKLTASGCARQS